MAVAAYASLVSLTLVLDNLHYRAEHHCPSLDIKVIKALQEGFHFLLNFVEVHCDKTGEGVEALWRKMAKFAFEAEDTIESLVVNELQWESREDAPDVGCSTFCQDMQKLIEKIEFMKEEIPEDIKKGDDDGGRLLHSMISMTVGSSRAIASTGESIMVGFDKHMNKILGVLTRDSSNLKIFPIVGTGGIGKTTLAKNIFEHPLIKNHFDVCIWVTISQEYSVKRILQNLLNEQENDKNGEGMAQLGERLHKRLFGRRYLVVMDDLWSTEAWDELRMSLPNNGNGSWILLTTRILNVGDYAGGSGNSYLIDFLSDDQSWNLLCKKVFAKDNCPYVELEGIGKSIAKSCRGLPLLINVIGGLLANSSLSKESWELIAQNVNSLGHLKDDDYCLKSISLSYDCLPISVKPCFLYMRVYPEDGWIDVSDLINFWVVEGYLKLGNDQHLEEIGEEYVKVLVDRNLIFVRRRTIGGEIEACGVHDLLRDFCIKESAKECFIYSPKAQHKKILRNPFIDAARLCKRYLCFDCSGRRVKPARFASVKVQKSKYMLADYVEGNPWSNSGSRYRCARCNKKDAIFLEVFKWDAPDGNECFLCSKRSKNNEPTNVALKLVHSSASASAVHLFFCDACEKAYSHNVSRIKLVKTISDGSYDSLQPSGLRYLSIEYAPDINFELPFAFNLLWNLQTLRIQEDSYKATTLVLPPQIWEMAQLRHLDVSKAVLPRPEVTHSKENAFIILKNLQTLSNIKKFMCAKDIFERIPNVKKLVISEPESPSDLSHLRKIESLCIYSGQNIVFPESLKKLDLKFCSMSLEDMIKIGSLPSLEELSLNLSGVQSGWDSIEGEFRRLKGLSITNCDVVYWRADDDCFPKLEWLVLERVQDFEIPLEIGCMNTLRQIELRHCGKCVEESALEICKEHRDLGNENLQIHVADNSWEEHQVNASSLEEPEVMDQILKARLIKIRL
ncbi:putative late blight resistance protein homolog R1A-3 [Andrographis paniculata]|uniref:putative late blight resistance protein homolog R1A-3 n=1 Tax=Andrographis paniculata TaxID=175694 RepID=UPI0021E872D9|nr:putative late blight resistance protein homolog R1A-3 [Andrographis paniculata]XP_051135866.1 putative late blight resistance protein homolog R1A-3 [Andrographis paniculata]XP_051135867.1 putative late blight resistance protein homolog R1A-3 [Andrographis paniculata]